MIIQDPDMNGRHTGWLDHSEYLQARTPLTERQADVLALWKNGQSLDEIGDTLGLPSDRVEDHWSDILDQWDRAQEFCTILGPQPWVDGEMRQPDAIDDTTWNLLASTARNESDEIEIHDQYRDVQASEVTGIDGVRVWRFDIDEGHLYVSTETGYPVLIEDATHGSSIRFHSWGEVDPIEPPDVEC